MNKHSKYILSVICTGALLLSACGEQNTDAPSESQTAVTFSAVVSDAVSETEAVSEAETESETESEAETEAASETTSAETEQSETEAISETETESAPETEAAPTEETTVTETEAAPQNDYSAEPVSSVIIGDGCFAVGEITDVEGVFGTPSSPPQSAPSCMGEGTDMTYIYDDVTVTSFVSAEGKETVTSLIVTGSSVKNPKGLDVGISEADALAILGDYFAEINGTEILFIAENGAVIEVDYSITL